MSNLDEIAALKELVRALYNAARDARSEIGNRSGNQGNPPLTWIKLDLAIKAVEGYSRAVQSKN